MEQKSLTQIIVPWWRFELPIFRLTVQHINHLTTAHPILHRTKSELNPCAFVTEGTCLVTTKENLMTKMTKMTNDLARQRYPNQRPYFGIDARRDVAIYFRQVRLSLCYLAHTIRPDAT